MGNHGDYQVHLICFALQTVLFNSNKNNQAVKRVANGTNSLKHAKAKHIIFTHANNVSRFSNCQRKPFSLSKSVEISAHNRVDYIAKVATRVTT